jgi:hypothetical protein
MTKKRKFNWDQQIQYAQYALDKNKALIEDTSRGTTASKTNTWSRKTKRSKSPLQ